MEYLWAKDEGNKVPHFCHFKGSLGTFSLKTPVVEFGLKLEHGQTMNINIQAIVVPKITGIIQRAPIILRILIEHQVADRGPVIVEDLCGLLI